MAVEEVSFKNAAELLGRLMPRTISTPPASRRRRYRGQGDAEWSLLPSAFRAETRFPWGSIPEAYARIEEARAIVDAPASQQVLATLKAQVDRVAQVCP